MPNLLPVENTDTDTLGEGATENEKITGYRQSISFDFGTGDFLRDGANRLIKSSGHEAWVQWCIKCLQTQRYAYLAYPDTYGIDIEMVFNTTTRAEAENELTRQITEALKADPLERLSFIESMTFNWMDDTSVVVDLSLVGIDGNTADFQTLIAA